MHSPQVSSTCGHFGTAPIALPIRFMISSAVPSTKIPLREYKILVTRGGGQSESAGQSSRSYAILIFPSPGERSQVRSVVLVYPAPCRMPSISGAVIPIAAPSGAVGSKPCNDAVACLGVVGRGAVSIVAGGNAGATRPPARFVGTGSLRPGDAASRSSSAGVSRNTPGAAESSTVWLANSSSPEAGTGEFSPAACAPAIPAWSSTLIPETAPATGDGADTELFRKQTRRSVLYVKAWHWSSTAHSASHCSSGIPDSEGSSSPVRKSPRGRSYPCRSANSACRFAGISEGEVVVRCMNRVLARRVLATRGEGCPSTAMPASVWNCRIAARVFGPVWPSTGPAE